MATAVVAPETEAQCGHPSRTRSNRPGREVCDDCKQLFESGLPVKAYSEAPPPVPMTTAKPPITEAPSINKKSAKAKKSTALGNVSESDLLDQTQKTGEDKLSSSIATMPADELHKEIIQTYVALGENALMYQALVLDGRRRMKDGEKVGGYTTWGEYANSYLKRQDESLPSCLRRLRRALEGKNPDTKHRNHRKKSNRKILEESLDQNERLVRNATDSGYEKGFADGEKAGEKKIKMLAAKPVADQKKKTQKTDDAPVDDSETSSKEEAARHIVCLAASVIKHFSLVEKHWIVDEVVARLRDESARDAADAQEAISLSHRVRRSGPTESELAIVPKGTK
jgi:hypothetical protein